MHSSTEWFRRVGTLSRVKSISNYVLMLPDAIKCSYTGLKLKLALLKITSNPVRFNPVLVLLDVERQPYILQSLLMRHLILAKFSHCMKKHDCTDQQYADVPATHLDRLYPLHLSAG